jgi:hypothetical protein
MTTTLQYQSGFGNQFATEAVPGALPVGRNSPQKAPHGLYAELLSGSAFTAPRADNRRTWMYRRLPSVAVAGYQPLPLPFWMTGAAAGVEVPPDPLRWHPAPMPTQPLDFLEGLRTMVVNGDADAQTGVAAHLVLCNRSMDRRAFVNSDGEMLLVPQSGRFTITTELGVLEAAPGEIVLLPRGMAFSVAVDGPASAYVCENYGAAFRLPELGPIGSNGLANPRDFLAPVAAFDAEPGAWDIVKKFGGSFWTARQPHSPLQRRRLARQPRALQVRHGALHDDRLDQLRPPGSVDLHRAHQPERHARHRELRLRDLPAALDGGRGHLPPALVPPQRDERVHGPRSRPVRRQARRLQARWCQPAQHHGPARPGRRGLRQGRQRCTSAAQAGPHPGLHVRKPLAIPPHGLGLA